MWQAWDTGEMFRWGDMRERNHKDVVEVEEKIILKWIFKK